MNDLKVMITKQIKNQYKMSLDGISKENIFDQVEKLHNIEIPKNLVEQELLLITQDLKPEDIKKHKNVNVNIAKNILSKLKSYLWNKWLIQ